MLSPEQLAAIRERAIVVVGQPWSYISLTRRDLLDLLAEIDRLTAELAEASARTHALAERLLASQSDVGAGRGHCVGLVDRVAVLQAELVEARARPDLYHPSTLPDS